MKNLTLLGSLILFYFNINAQINIKWEETFPDSIVPAGWQVIDNDGSGMGLQLFPSVTPQTGQHVFPQSGQHFWSSNYQNANLAGVIDEWLISPQISVIYSSDSLYFWAGAIGGSFDDSLRVLISTSGNQLWDFNHLIGYFKVDGPVGSWHKYGFDLSAFDSMDIHFAINYYIKDGGPGGQYSEFVWIDHCFLTGDSSTINQPPTEFNLLEPINYSLLHPVADSTIYFKWSSSTNADNDTLKYRLEILDVFPTLVFNNIIDTTFAFDWHGLLNHYAVYRWTVSVTDGKSTACSPDTFLFFTPPIENLAPFPFPLVSPQNGDTVSLADTINFKWRKAIDPNSDTLTYGLNIFGNSLDTTFNIISDTSYILFNAGIFEHDQFYQWTVTASDNQYSTSSLNTWSFIMLDPTSLINNLNPIPDKIVLNQNYPNPFNPSTKIKYTLPKSKKVKIEVFNLLGQKISTILNKQIPAGSHEIEFTSKNLPSGVYLYRIEAGEYQEVRKMILMK